jgi:hypothetical protein
MAGSRHSNPAVAAPALKTPKRPALLASGIASFGVMVKLTIKAVKLTLNFAQDFGVLI